MPLMKSKSKQAFSTNVKEMMDAGHPMKQSLAAAYAIKRQAGVKKKYAKGGEVLGSKDEDLKMDSADDIGQHDMDMLDDAKMSKSMGQDAKSEHMGGIDDEKDMRSMDMMKQKAMYAKGGMVGARDEHMSGISDQDEELSENMLDDHSSRHSMELDAKKEHMVTEADMGDHDMDMLHQSSPEDSYSKDGVVRYARGGVVDKIMRKREMQSDHMFAEGGEVADLQEGDDEHLNMEDQLSYDAPRKKTYFDLDQLDDQPMDSNEHGHELPDEDSYDDVDKLMKKMASRRRMMK